MRVSRYAEIAALAFLGAILRRKSYEAWVKKYWAKKSPAKGKQHSTGAQIGTT